MAVELTLTVTGGKDEVESLIKIWEILAGNKLDEDLEEYTKEIEFVLACLVEQDGIPFWNDELLDALAKAQAALRYVSSGEWRPSREEIEKAQP